MSYYDKKIKQHSELLEKAMLAGNDKEIKVQESHLENYIEMSKN